jgi:hypothetical protein
MSGIGFAGTIFFMVRYGPFGVLAAIAGFLGFFYWKNEARKSAIREYDDHRSTEGAFERYISLPGVRKENVED